MLKLIFNKSFLITITIVSIINIIFIVKNNDYNLNNVSNLSVLQNKNDIYKNQNALLEDRLEEEIATISQSKILANNNLETDQSFSFLNLIKNNYQNASNYIKSINSSILLSVIIVFLLFFATLHIITLFYLFSYLLKKNKLLQQLDSVNLKDFESYKDSNYNLINPAKNKNDKLTKSVNKSNKSKDKYLTKEEIKKIKDIKKEAVKNDKKKVKKFIPFDNKKNPFSKLTSQRFEKSKSKLNEDLNFIMAEGYFDLKMYPDAWLSSCRSLSDNYSLPAVELQLKICVATQKWRLGAQIASEYENKIEKSNVLSDFYFSLAKNAYVEGNNNSAKSYIEKALKFTNQNYFFKKLFDDKELKLIYDIIK